MKWGTTAGLVLLGTIFFVGTVAASDGSGAALAAGVSGALFFSPFFLFVVGADGRIDFTWAADVPSDQPEWREVRDAVGRVKGDV